MWHCSFLLQGSFFSLVILLVTVIEEGKLCIKGLIYRGETLFYNSLARAHDDRVFDFSLNFPTVFSSFSFFLLFSFFTLFLPPILVFGHALSLLFTPFLFSPSAALTSALVLVELFGPVASAVFVVILYPRCLTSQCLRSCTSEYFLWGSVNIFNSSFLY